MSLKFTLQTIGRRSLVEINVHAVEYRRARQLNQKIVKRNVPNLVIRRRRGGRFYRL